MPLSPLARRNTDGTRRERLIELLGRIELRPVLVDGRNIVLAQEMADALLMFVEDEVARAVALATGAWRQDWDW